jgi:hypothetical protein
MDNNQIDFKLGLDFSAINEALAQIRAQFKGTDAEFAKIAKSITASFNKAEAAAQLYGKESAQVVAANNALQKSFVQLGASGIDYTSNSFKQLNQEALKVSNTMTSAGASVKKSNMGWTNLALVIQDLPYGFRGIQNNLPALVGSFASATGPIYLGISAVIAAITAWDMGLFGVKKKTDEAKKSQDSYNESLKTAMSSAFGEISQVKALVSVVENHGLSIDKRRIALKKLQDEYPAYFNNMSVEKTSINQLTSATNSLTSAIIARAEANAMTAEVEKLATQRYENTKSIEKNETAILNMNNALGILSKTEEKHMNQFGTVTRTKSPYDVQLGKIKELEKANKDLGTQNEIIQNKIAQLQNSINFRMQQTILLDYKQEKSSKQKAEKQKVEYFDLTKAVDDYYAAKMNFAEGDNRAQREILKQQQMTYDDMLSNNLISTVKWYDKTSDLYKQIYELTRKIKEQDAKDAESFASSRVSNVEARLNTELKLHKGNLRQQKKDVKAAMAEIAVLQASSFDSSAIAVYAAELEKLGYKLEALGDDFDATARQISGIVSGMLGDALATIGENLGNALAGGKFDPFGALLDILANGLSAIGKALIAYGVAMDAFKKAFSNPYAAIAAGVALVAAGAFLKAKVGSMSQPAPSGDGVQKFANGGIISGPTYGLMGEYPGAKSNPEVVAPLDKLKDMIGGQGSGQFVLRGQDLVLALNRSEKSLTLRRG